MTQVQRECLAVRGDCAKCRNNTLESQACKVKYSTEVALALGLKPITRKQTALEKVRYASCAMCDATFSTFRPSDKTCAPCMEKKARPGMLIATCPTCFGRHWSTKKGARCVPCREAA